MARMSLFSFVVLLSLAILAFWPHYLSRSFPAIGWHTHVHAAAALLWFLLLIAQATAIQTGKRTLHRFLGRASPIAASFLVVSSIRLAHHRFATMDDTTFKQEAFTLYLPIYATILFSVCYVMAIAYRRSPTIHARLMCCTAVVLIDPVVARLLSFYFPPPPAQIMNDLTSFLIADLVLLVLMLSAKNNPAALRAMAIVISLFVSAQILWFVLAPSSAWFAFATWFRRLPLT